MHRLVRARIVVENTAKAGRAAASRQGGALVLEDLLEHVAQDRLRVVRIRHVLAHAQDVAALADVVLDVVVCALVSQLRQADLLGRELLVEIVEIETGRGQFLKCRGKDCCLEGWHGSFELRGYQSQGLVLHSYLRIELDSLRD